jgi:hypothetical protein
VAGKYGLAGMLIWWLTRWPGARLPAFIAGVAVTQAVLLLKALGRALTGEAPPARWRERFMEREHNRMRGT